MIAMSLSGFFEPFFTRRTKMNSTVEMITPEYARQILEHNTKNRKPRTGLVAQYARAMERNDWKLTHQGIAINCDGTLLDGQHRLLAVISSGVTVRMLVTRGVPSDSQVAMDDHCPRSVSDALTLMSGQNFDQHVCAIAKACVNLGGKQGNMRLSKPETYEVFTRLADGFAFIREFTSGTRERGVSSAPVWAAVALAYYYEPDVKRLKEFCQTLRRSRHPEPGDFAAITLREWLLKAGASAGGSTARLETFRKTQRAILAFIDRQDIRKLYGNDSKYRWPLVNTVRDNGEEVAA